MDNFYNMAKIAVLSVPKKFYGKMSYASDFLHEYRSRQLKE